MRSPAAHLIAEAHHFLAGRASFGELYRIALELDLELKGTQPDSLAARLSGAILLAEGELTSGGQTVEGVRSTVADVLLEDAITRAS